MARVSYVEPQNASPQVKAIYDKKLKGKPGNTQKALAHRPELLGSFLAFYGSVGNSLDRKLYELLYIRVSILNQRNLTVAPSRFVEASRSDPRRRAGAEVR